jgi:hypothetical protein
MINLILPLAALLLNDFLPHENMTPGFQDQVNFVDYTPSDTTVPDNGLFIRASLGYLGDVTEPIMIPIIPAVTPPPAVWPGPWPGGTDTTPRGPIVWPPPPPIVIIPVPDPPDAQTPEPSTMVLFGAGLFAVLLGKEMRRTYRYA